jgi:hypothetical protein
VDKYLPILPVTIGNGTLQNVLLDGAFGINMIKEEEQLWYRLRMADQPVVELLGLIKNIKIHIHGIPYFISLTVIRNTEVNDAYSMLLGHPWLIDAKVNYDWGNNMVTIRGNGIVKTIYVS